MKLSVRLFLLLTTLVIALSPAFSAVIYVTPNGNDGNSGASWSLAKKTISEGLTAAVSGDEVWVAAGIYTETITLKAGVKLYGGFNGAENNLSERNPKINSTVITNAGGDLVTGANGALIDGFVIHGGTNGIRCINTSPEINGNVIMQCITAGISNSSGSPVITNNIIILNNSNGISSSSGSPKIINNTILRNGNYGISVTTSGSPVISANIVAYNKTGIYKGSGSFSPILSFNDVYGNVTDYNPVSTSSLPRPTDISEDPKFASLDYGDLHIQSDSPCKDAVDTPATDAPTVDMDGQARPYGAKYDIGADESYDETHSVTPTVLYVNWAVASSGDGTTWATAYKTIQEAVDTALARGPVDIRVAKGTYVEQVKLKPFAHIFGGYEAGSDVADPKNNTTIIDAGNILSGNNVITACSMSGVTGFTLRGGYYGVYCSNASPIIRNNVIMLNTAQGIHCMNTSHPVIDGNRIIANGGNGITANDSSPLITNNVIIGHTIGIQAANSGAPMIINNTLAGNRTGITTASAVVNIVNNIIVNSETGVNRGGASSYNPVLVTNNLYGNTADYYPTTLSHDSDISVDPQFASTDYGDFRIKADSPCRDAGTSSLAGIAIPARDIDGDERPEGAAVDIGADESYGQTYDNYPTRIVYVKGSAAEGGDGTTWNTAFRTIQAGLDDTLAKGGAEVHVALGTYEEKITLRPYAYLYGGFVGDQSDPDNRSGVTIIAPKGSDSVVTATNLAAVNGKAISVIDGFTIQGGMHGIYCTASSPTIRNNTITGCSGYGIYCQSSSSPIIQNNRITATGSGGINVLAGCSPTIEDNTIADTADTNGLGINFAAISSGAISSGTVTRNTIIGHKTGIVAYDSSEPIITCNLIVGNTQEGILCSRSKAVVTNNTVVANGTGFNGWNAADVKVYNNIIANNVTGISLTNNLPDIRNNNVFGNTSTDYSGVVVPSAYGNISVDPKFVSLEYGNFHLRADSGCLDAGNPAAPYIPALDLDGEPRVINTVDIGAYEFETDPYSDPYEPRKIYVDQTKADGGDGKSWDKAYKTIKQALDNAITDTDDVGAEIWVAQGTYTETVKLKRFIHLFGGFSGVELNRDVRDFSKYTTTIQSPLASYHVVTGSTLSTIDGFTITGGSSGVECKSVSPTIRNNIIKGNANGINCEGSLPVIEYNTIFSNSSTGVRCVSSSPIIAGNRISGNPTGILCEGSSPAITRNTIFGNGTTGIDIKQSSAPTITNNMVVVNGSGVKCLNSSPMLINNTIAYNSSRGLETDSSKNAKIYNNIIAYNNGGVYVTGDSPSLSNNNVYHNFPDYSNLALGSNDISVDPQFVSPDYGDFHLLPTSLCRDSGRAGDPITPVPTTDFDGATRTDPVDIGADEFDPDYTHNSRTVYVDAEAPPGGNGENWITAYSTVQEAIDDTVIHGGADIRVAKGTYGKIIMRPFAHVFGGYDAATDLRDIKGNETIIDSNTTSGGIATVTAASFATIDGFTIDQGYYGVNCVQASPTIANCKFTANEWGIRCNGGSAKITNALLIGTNSYGIRCENYSTPTIANCVIVGKKTSSYVGIYCSSSTPIITNNTLYGCNVGIQFNPSNKNIIVSNNIVAFGTRGIYIYSGSEHPVLESNCVAENTTNYYPTGLVHNDINVDPLFVDPLAGDFHLQETSPCIDRGNDLAPGLPLVDMDGELRKQGRCVDIGADETPGGQIDPVDITSAKQLKDGTVVANNTSVVTAVFEDFFYIESLDRSCGIRVNKDDHGLSVGWFVDIEGVMGTDPNTKERCINATKAERIGTNTEVIKPMAMSNALLGGGDFGTLPDGQVAQVGVENGFGLNNIGLLVKAYGRVTADSVTSFYITDGSGVTVRVSVPVDVTVPEAGSYVSVVGISTCEGANRSRLILARDGDDIFVLKPAQEPPQPVEANLIDAKKMDDGALVTLPALSVSRVFSDHFYVQTDDRDCGIMVKKHGSDPVSINTKVIVTGTLRTDQATGERYIEASAHPSAPGVPGGVKPLAMTNKSLGGGDFKDPGTGIGQSGVKDGAGLNNIGLLVRTCGYVTLNGAGDYLLDDGSGVPVKLISESGEGIISGTYSIITGVSSCWKDSNSDIQRQIKIAGADDVQTLFPPGL